LLLPSSFIDAAEDDMSPQSARRFCHVAAIPRCFYADTRRAEEKRVSATAIRDMLRQERARLARRRRTSAAAPYAYGTPPLSLMPTTRATRERVTMRAGARCCRC